MSDYNYLSGLSSEAQQVIIGKIEHGEINLYHSIMSVLGNRKQRGCFKDRETENKHYRKYSKRQTDLSDVSKPLFDEIFNFCYDRFENREHKELRQPLTTKENMIIAKGAMIKALEKCNVSEKNIIGMIGVLDNILRTTSEYRLKAAYKDYMQEHQEQEL